ncbi:hypothetical protein ACSBR2_024551 [Camellia fascicularis]
MQFKSPTNPVHPQFVVVLAGSPRFSPSSPSLSAPSSSISAETTYPPRKTSS